MIFGGPKKKVETIGLIAGNGHYPLIFARKARESGYHVVAVGVQEETERSLESVVDHMHWISVVDLKKLIDFFKTKGVSDLVMAGQIQHKRLFSGMRPDPALAMILASVRDWRADTLLGAIAKYLKRHGIHLRDSRMFLGDLLPKKGVLTRAKPDANHMKDIRFGFDIAKRLSAFDVGQSIAVKEKSIVAVEAMEGTDEMIRRAAHIAGPGVVIVKVSKAKQDIRFDVPCIGSRTVNVLAETGSGPLAIEAGQTLILDKEKVLDQANQQGVSLVAV